MKKFIKWAFLAFVALIFVSNILMGIAKSGKGTSSTTSKLVETARTPTELRNLKLERLTDVDETRAIYTMLLASIEICSIEATETEIRNGMKNWAHLSAFKVSTIAEGMMLQPTFSEIMGAELSPRGQSLTKIRVRSLTATDGCDVSKDILAKIAKLS